MDNERFDALMEQVRCNDMSALEEIYLEYSGYIYQCMYILVQQKEDAEDLASDFFVKLYQKADKYEPGHSHKSYLAVMARNMAIDFMRKNKREILYDDVPDKENSVSVEDNVVESVFVEHLMKLLSVRQQEIVHLKFFGGFTLAQIAESLDIPLGTVNWNFRQAKEVLRRYNYEI
jgi:RNA polymerase sigma-70 factor (ECF subfamily)